MDQNRFTNNLLPSVRYDIAKKEERSSIISVIEAVGSEHRFLQTDHYQPSYEWEALLSIGVDRNAGILLIVVKYIQSIIGFGRLYPDAQFGRKTGNVGVVLLPAFRSKGVGTALLGILLTRSPTFGFNKLSANILANNLVSIRLFQHYSFLERDRHSIQLPYLNEPAEEITVELDLLRQGRPPIDVPHL